MKSLIHSILFKKKNSTESDVCKHCENQQLVTQIVAGVIPQELRQKLQSPFFSYTTSCSGHLCRSFETSIKDLFCISNRKVKIMKNKNFKSHLEKAINYHRKYEYKQGMKGFNCGKICAIKKIVRRNFLHIIFVKRKVTGKICVSKQKTLHQQIQL